MASIADNSTAMNAMNEANLDFLELIRNFKAFFNGTDTVTFNLVQNDNLPIGSGTITMNSLQKLVSDYRNGAFESVVVGDQSTGVQFILTTDDDNNLVITDMAGNPARVSCEKFDGSIIQNSTVVDMTATSCTINSVETPVAVKGGSAELESLKLDYLEVNNLSTPSIDASVVSVRDSLTCKDMLILGSRKLVITNPKNIFFKDNAPIDNAIDGVYFDSNNNWIMAPAPGSVTPTDMGFATATATSSAVAGCSLPGFCRFWGVNVQSKFKKGIFASSPAPTNLRAFVSIDGTSFVKCDIGLSSFSHVIAWPTGFVTPDEGSAGELYLSSFLPSDFGKEIFYRTTWNEWKIYRSMVVTVKDGAVDAVNFTDEMLIPKFSCYRFVANKHDPYEESYGNPTNRDIIYTLERA